MHGDYAWRVSATYTTQYSNAKNSNGGWQVNFLNARYWMLFCYISQAEKNSNCLFFWQLTTGRWCCQSLGAVLSDPSRQQPDISMKRIFFNCAFYLRSMGSFETLQLLLSSTRWKILNEAANEGENWRDWFHRKSQLKSYFVTDEGTTGQIFPEAGFDCLQKFDLITKLVRG